MNPRNVFFLAWIALGCGVISAESKNAVLPDRLVIARDTFWDFGPPFSYYDLIQITKTGDGLSLDQVLVTPHGNACLQPAKVEERTAVLHKTMTELLDGRNPCAVPEKDIHHEATRCKHCPVFSGVNLTMEATCNGQSRRLDIRILDRDIYDRRTPTPENTSWSMRLLSILNDALGPGSEAQPVFQIGVAQHHEVPQTSLVSEIREGHYDNLFGNDSVVSKIVHEADQPPPPMPSVKVLSVAPYFPLNSDAPRYPPIAIAARVEGIVHASFDVTADGTTQDIKFQNGARLKMLEGAANEAISKWNFPPPARGQSGKVAIQFALNCHDDSQ